MSGFGTDLNNKHFINVYAGNLTIRTDEETAKKEPNGVIRTNQNGKQVYELHYPFFDGQLCNIYSEKHETFGNQICFDFIADNQIYCLRVPAKGRQATNLIERLPNVDFDKEVRLRAFADKYEDGGVEKISTALIFAQGKNEDGRDKYVPQYWSKDNPRERPAPKQVEYEGQERWDYSGPRNYMLTYIKNNIIPKLPKIDQNMVESAQAQSKPKPVPPTEEETDDLPFIISLPIIAACLLPWILV